MRRGDGTLRISNLDSTRELQVGQVEAESAMDRPPLLTGL